MRERTREKKIKTSPEPQFQPIISSIPDDILLQIFTRLPVRSLGRLSCVSKSWHSLIFSPNLVKSHYKRCTEDKENEHHRIMFFKVELEHDERLGYGFELGVNFRLRQFGCSLHSAFSCVLPKKIEVTNDFIISIPVEKFRYYINKTWGSCRGLVLIMVEGESMLLWNPATRNYRELPDSGIKKEHKLPGSSRLSCGIGYDESNDDFKVLVLSSVGGMRNETLAKVYSWKTDSWKKIEDLKYSLIELGGCYCLNGIFHFIAYDPQSRGIWNIASERKIVGLDLANDIFKEIELPEEVITNCTWKIGTLRGCLSLFLYSGGNQVDVWLMKEYGVRESWSKVVVVPCFQYPDGNVFSKPLILSENGQLLFVTGPRPKLGVYDPNENSLHYSQFINLEYHYEVDVCVESLISP
ncbi:F-box/kelch-repeat protein At3g23880-like [Coffea eugenioides]|uniref:F-box/kelch-repeat protein At3g23880-like n=1 Tax=Coffea eugenioides TaxID=49369 RepID=UPI000F60CD6F|nr:F-box/kelch-repeat protein At3g23880-like [Coffea eugenioides]XP_027149967.1 F-box/kelch-repeat protein At3g23880-like [Coffea eugenioides]